MNQSKQQTFKKGNINILKNIFHAKENRSQNKDEKREYLKLKKLIFEVFGSELEKRII